MHLCLLPGCMIHSLLANQSLLLVHRYPIALVELLRFHSDVLILILSCRLQSCSGYSSVVYRVGCHLALKVFLRLELF